MSESEGEVAETQEVQDSGELNLESAISQVLMKARHRGSISRGINEVCYALDSGKALICFLSDSCDHDGYKKLITGLCQESGVPIIKVADGQLLGRLAGLCKIDAEGEPRKVVRTSSVTVNNFGEDSAAKTWLEEYASKQG